jgi:tripartite-type tricarboxylate transporter receptor subunit TctC
MLVAHHLWRRASALIVVWLVALASFPLGAQTWPDRPIKLIVTQSPGGATDLVARLVAKPLGEALGQSILVENKPGAGGIIGTDIAAKAAPDGYTLLMLLDVNTIYPSTSLKLNHDPASSFAPISLIGRGSHVLVLHPSVPANNLQELVAYIRAHPGELSAALPSYAGPQHLALEMIKSFFKIDVTPIPYKGGGQAIADVVGGQVKFGLLGMAPAIPFIRAGKLKAIAVTGSTRSSALPDVATVAESGIPGFETNQWQSMVAPAGTPSAIINRIHAELVKVMQLPAVKEKLATIGMDNSSSASPEDLAKLIRAELDRWPGIVKAAGIKPE